MRRRFRFKPTDHYNGRFFFNPWVREARESFVDYLRWKLFRKVGEWPVAMDSAPTKPTALRADEAIRITFVNHATLLVQLPGFTLLTDPVWSNRVGPFSWLGVRRRRPPGIRFEDLPPIDAVVISHNHYDHMDAPTIRRLEARSAPLWIVPLGDRRNLEKLGVSRVSELDWWESVSLKGTLRVTATPAQHWSQRTFHDINRSLWMGWVLSEEGSDPLYFAGDTGYGPHFKQIAERFPNLGVACLPIGAYAPRAVTALHHLDPEESVRAFRDLGAETMIPIHHGTFPLADEPFSEPRTRIFTAWRNSEMENERLVWLDEGRSFSGTSENVGTYSQPASWIVPKKLPFSVI